MIPDHDTIVAPATAAGGAIAVVRVSGREAFALCDRVFRGRKPLAEADGYTVHYGEIMDGDRIVDDVLAAVFRAPHSYTGEDSVEISCHGSSYIVSEILRLLTAAGGRITRIPCRFASAIRLRCFPVFKYTTVVLNRFPEHTAPGIIQSCQPKTHNGPEPAGSEIKVRKF